MTKEDDAPYEPKYKGFDAEATKRAHATMERAQENAGARGEDANREYVDDGPAEYARRTGESVQEDEPAAPPEAVADDTPDHDTKITHRGKK